MGKKGDPLGTLKATIQNNDICTYQNLPEEIKHEIFWDSW